MNTYKKHLGFGQKIMAVAILAAFGPVHADEVTEMTQPESSVSVGASSTNGNGGDKSIFGQYDGLRDHKGNLILDLDLVKRENTTGTWLTLQGRNLGLDNREFNASYGQQGDWKVSAGYDEITHHELRTINTGDTGVGTSTPNVVRLATAGTGSDVDLKLQRKAGNLGVEKWLTSNLLFDLSFKSESKDGARFTGKGYDCAAYVCTGAAGVQAKNTLLMQAEPVATKTRQLEMRLSFHDEKLNVNAGYYGSFFTNSNGNVSATVQNSFNNGIGTAGLPGGLAVGAGVIAGGGLSLQQVLQLPFALPPDNQAHQFYADGNYAFTKTTKATFKYAYTHATQDRDFQAMGLTGAPGNASNLGGVVDTTLFQFGLTAKPMPKLSLLGNVRYESKQDKTPSRQYNQEAQLANPVAVPTYSNLNQPNVTSAQWFNGKTSGSKLAIKGEASYQFPEAIRGTVGVDYTKLEREVPTDMYEDRLAGLGTVRAKNDELGYRLELRRTMSETLNGAIGYTSSTRKGSDWTSLSTLNPLVPGGLTAANLALVNAFCGGVTCYGQTLSAGAILAFSQTSSFPMSMVDVKRDKWKLSADWNPVDRASVQFSIEDGKEDNTTQTSAISEGRGWQQSTDRLYSVDASFVLSDAWKLTGYASRSDKNITINHSTYSAKLKDQNDAFGLGLVGKVSGKLEIGANLGYANDVNKYDVSALSTTGGSYLAGFTVVAPTAPNIAQAAIGMPDVKFSQTTFNIFAKYGLDKHSDLRFDLVNQRASLKEWAWGNNGVPFVYGDNTTVSIKESQSVTYLGARYIYKWQ